LAGRAAFAGATSTDIIAAVLEREPDWAALPAAVPHRVTSLLRRCLRKDQKQRLRDIGDAVHTLTEAEEPDSPPPTAHVAAHSGATTSSGPRVPRRLAVGTLALALVAAGAGLAWWLAPGESAAPGGVRMLTSVLLPTGLRLDVSAPLALSPDGTTLAFVAVNEGGERHLYTRSLASDQNTLVPGSKGASHPFFSPDSRFIAFFADGALQKVSATGGSPLRVCPLPGRDRGGA
jgi:hypothetical protein